MNRSEIREQAFKLIYSLEIQKQEDHRESMRYRKMVSKIKQHELNELDDAELTDSIKPVNMSKFDPTMKS